MGCELNMKSIFILFKKKIISFFLPHFQRGVLKPQGALAGSRNK